MHAIFGDPQKKVILSIDGGGMRGVIPLAMLTYLEEATGKPAFKLFDMVAGTSTGAIIAAGLALRFSAKELLEKIYLQSLPLAFGNTGFRSWFNFIKSGFKYRYDLKPFFADLGYLAGDTQVGEIDHIIFLVTTKDVRTGNTYYVVNKGPGAAKFADWPLAGAVAASAAAPVFFPPVVGNFIDGGVGVQGNPSLAATIEAMEYIGAAEGFVDDEVILVSMGTGYLPQNKPDGAAAKFRIMQWIDYIVQEYINDSALQQAYATRAIYGKRLDVRRYDPYLYPEALQSLAIENNGVDPTILGLDSTQPQQLELMRQIGRCYAEQIDWSVPCVFPWDTIGGHPRPSVNAEADWSQLLR